MDLPAVELGKELADRRAECPCDPVQHVYGGGRLAVLDLGQHALRAAGEIRDILQPQAATTTKVLDAQAKRGMAIAIR